MGGGRARGGPGRVLPMGEPRNNTVVVVLLLLLLSAGVVGGTAAPRAATQRPAAVAAAGSRREAATTLSHLHRPALPFLRAPCPSLGCQLLAQTRRLLVGHVSRPLRAAGRPAPLGDALLGSITRRWWV